MVYLSALKTFIMLGGEEKKAAAHTGRTQFGSLLAVIELLVLLSLSRSTQVLM